MCSLAMLASLFIFSAEFAFDWIQLKPTGSASFDVAVRVFKR